MNYLQEIVQTAKEYPEKVAVSILDSHSSELNALTYSELLSCAIRLAKELNQVSVDDRPIKVGVVIDNGPLWVVSDLAILLSGNIQVPVPSAFSKAQASGMIDGVDCFLLDSEGLNTYQNWMVEIDDTHHILLDDSYLQAGQDTLTCVDLVLPEKNYVCKVIHTSGTTGNPKGVRIKYDGLMCLLESLVTCIGKDVYRRYLSLVPLSLLIEQVTGIYLPLVSRGRVIFLDKDIPLLGVSNKSAESYLDIIRSSRPTSLTLTPALVEAIHQEAKLLEIDHVPLAESLFGQADIPFMACGGAPTNPSVLKQLYYRGITIYEGYGLSENSSVVSLNTKENYKIGTVGKPLPHVQVRISDEGELLLKSSSLFDGYENRDPSACDIDSEGWLHTGDLASLDCEGYISIRGRIKNIIITANARNISPEWVETTYRSLDFVDTVALIGDGLEKIYGLFVVDDDVDLGHAEEEIAKFGNENLSDVERVDEAVLVRRSDKKLDGLFTITGRPIRSKIVNKFILDEGELSCIA